VSDAPGFGYGNELMSTMDEVVAAVVDCSASDRDDYL
jgi:hypothetical protein